MPHSSLKIRPGLDQNDTPALNEAGFSTSNLIRFIYDRIQGGLVQKLGGWTKFFPNTVPAVIRALWAWEDTQSITHLAYGTQLVTTTSVLAVITNGVTKNITPKYAVSDITAAVSSTSGSSYLTITDTVNTGITRFNSVFIATQISIGGIVLFGQYACDPNGFIGTTTYTVQSIDVLGNPLPATATSTSPVLPLFSVTSGSANVTVTLPNHGYTTDSTFPVLLSTTVGGATFYGNFPVQSVIDANNFTITSLNLPTSTTTGYLNGNLAHYVYSYGVGAIPSGSGYGANQYGQGGYGTGVSVTPGTGTAIAAVDWSLDNWGNVLLACPVNPTSATYQPIYQWDATGGSPTATVITNGPTVNDGFFVAMPQRQIVAWGSTFNGIQDPLLIRWCDVNDYNAWIGNVTNQAGSYRLPKGSKIIGCIQGPQQGLIWTDIGLWSMQYVGQPYIYSFNEIGSGCGMIGRKAAASVNGVVYWMGPSQFFKLSANGVEPVACPIWDVIFQDLDTTNPNKIRVAVNSRFGEITWYYPTMSSGGEVNAYAKYNVNLNCWDFGLLGRSAWIDQSVLGPPIGADPTSLYIYQHETSTDADGQPLLASFTTGYFALSEGDLKTFIDQVWPDMKWGYYNGSQNATINLSFNVVDYPGQTPTVYGPYALTQSTKFITPRFRGRLVSITMSSSDIGSFWRLGNLRYRFQQDGKF